MKRLLCSSTVLLALGTIAFTGWRLVVAREVGATSQTKPPPPESAPEIPADAIGPDPLSKADVLLAHHLSKALITQMLTTLGTGDLDTREAGLRDTLLASLARLSPSEALQMLQTYRSEETQDHLRRILAETWLQIDPQSALAWLSSSDNANLLAALLPEITESLESMSEPEQAALIAALPVGSIQQKLLSRLLKTWGRVNLDAALAWAIRLDGGELKQRALLRLGYRWIEEDPQEAMRQIQAMGPDFEGLLSTMANQWTARDPGAAIEWLAGLAEGPLRERFIPKIAATLAHTSPENAIRFVEALPTGPAREQAVRATVSGWSLQDPQAAFQWVRELPIGNTRNQALIQVLAGWAQNDPSTAAEWLSSAEDFPGRDIAVSTFSGSIVDRYPDVALAFAGNIWSTRLRTERIENVARRWIEVDRERATAAILALDLPAETTARLINLP